MSVEAIQSAAIRARDALERVRMHVKAGAIDPTEEQLIELFNLVCELVFVTEATAEDVCRRVEAFMLRVCPAAREVC